MELIVYVMKVMLCIKVFVILLRLQFLFVLVTAFLMVYFVHVMMATIKLFKENATNAQLTLFGMEFLVKVVFYVKTDTHSIIKQINVKQME
jgi:hypothetical protein